MSRAVSKAASRVASRRPSATAADLASQLSQIQSAYKLIKTEAESSGTQQMQLSTNVAIPSQIVAKKTTQNKNNNGPTPSQRYDMKR